MADQHSEAGSDLPEELVQEVVRRIRTPHDVARLSCVSRTWRECAVHLETLHFKMEDSVWGAKQLSSFPAVQKAQLMSAAIAGLVSKAQGLKELCIDASERDCLFDAADICRWISLMGPSLERLTLDLHTPNRWFHVDRPGADVDSVPLLAQVLRALSSTNVKHLTIRNCGWLTPKAFSSVETKCPKLDSLTMTGVLVVNGADGLDRLLLNMAPKVLHLGFVPLAPWPMSLTFRCHLRLQELHLTEEFFDQKMGFPALRLRDISVVGPELSTLTVKPITCLSAFNVERCPKLKVMLLQCQKHRDMNGFQTDLALPFDLADMDLACSNIKSLVLSF